MKKKGFAVVLCFLYSISAVIAEEASSMFVDFSINDSPKLATGQGLGINSSLIIGFLIILVFLIVFLLKSKRKVRKK